MVMTMRDRYVRLLSRILPLGAVGAALLLGSSLPANAAVKPSDESGSASVATRLAAIREAAFSVGGPAGLSNHPDPNIQLAWGNRWANWGRGGWRRPRWNNWRNFAPRWNNFWRNW